MKTCPNCGGLGAKVETYMHVDQEGRETLAWRDVPCGACGGSGQVPE